MVMAHTLVQLLRRQFDELHMAAPPATAALAERMAEVHTVHTHDFAHGELGLGRRRQTGLSLREEDYAACYVLPNSWKSALVPLFANIPKRVGWLGEARYGLLNDRRQLDKEAYPLMIERFMALADSDEQLPEKPYPRPKLQVDGDNLARLLADLELGDKPAVAICPGAEFGAAKKWPAGHYAEVAKELMIRGHAVWLMGSPNDFDDCDRIAWAAPGVTNLAGKTKLLDAVDLISYCQQVICNDSGLMHVACALNVPTIGVFGSTSPGFTPPLGDKAQVVARELDCRPCFQRECPLGHLDCLRQLHPREVLAKLTI